jgi:hypothetical protein
MTTTLQPLIDRSAEFDLHKHDYTELAQRLTFDESGKLVVPSPFGAGLFGGTPPLDLTERGLVDLCAKLVKPFWGSGSGRSTLPVDHHRQLRESMPDLFAQQMNRLLADHGDTWFVRGYEDKVRAIKSGQYADVRNTQLLEMVQAAVGDLPCELIRPHIDPDNLYLKVIVKHIEPNHPLDPGGFGVGFFVRNGETGDSGIEVGAVVQRHACTNSIVALRNEAGQQIGYYGHHRGSVAAKQRLMAAAIQDVLPSAFEALEAYLESHAQPLPNLADVIGALARSHGWDEGVTLAVATGSEGQNTKAGLINGVTHAAHSAGLEPGAAVALETLGGTLLWTEVKRLYELGVRHHDLLAREAMAAAAPRTNRRGGKANRYTYNDRTILP